MATPGRNRSARLVSVAIFALVYALAFPDTAARGYWFVREFGNLAGAVVRVASFTVREIITLGR